MSVAPRTVVVIRNPTARRAPSEDALRRETLEHLVSAGWSVDIQTTEAPGHATVLAARAAAAGVEVVAACGGDGTVHEVVNGIVGTGTALAVLPAGTLDVWAREARIPRTLAGAVALIPHARRVRIDVGRVRSDAGLDRRFLLMCGVGMDAEAVRRLHVGSRGKRWFGMVTYVAVAAWVMVRAAPTPARVRIGAVTLERPLLQLIAGNTRLYGVTRLTAGARVDDGLLDVCMFSGGGLWHRAILAARALWGGLDARAGGGIDYLRGTRMHIDADRPLPVQADGEYIGETPVSIDVDPEALDVLIARAPNMLLAGG